MIRKLRVEHFKSLVHLEIELGRVNVFVGANGSGKSNLLEAVGVLGAAASGRVDDEALLRRGVRPGVPRLYKAAFPSKVKVPGLLFSATSTEQARFEVSLSNPIENPDPAWRFMTERLERGPGDAVVTRAGKKLGQRNQEQGIAALATVELEAADPALRLMETLRTYGIHCPNTPALRGWTPDMQSREPVGLSGGRLPEAVEELLAAARRNASLRAFVLQVGELVDWAREFSAAPPVGLPLSPSASRSPLVVQFVDRYMKKGQNRLTGYDASEGALYILYCAALALHPKAPRCLAIDNVDQTLNPLLAKRLMTGLCDWMTAIGGDRQMLLTAHNPAILDGLPLADPEVRLFTVSRNNHGHTVVRRIDLAAAVQARPNTDWTLSRMWMAGLLGGVPNV